MIGARENHSSRIGFAKKNNAETLAALTAEASLEAASTENASSAAQAATKGFTCFPLGDPHQPFGEPSSINDDWLSQFRAVIQFNEKVHWQSLKDGTQSRKFVPLRVRLAKHYFDLLDSARRDNHETSIALMEAKLKRMAFNHPRWGALL